MHLLRGDIQQHLSVSTRGYRRLRAGTGSTADARDAALLKRLESQLAELKKNIKTEEEDAHKFLERHASGEQAKADKNNQYVWFWEKALTDNDREKLATLQIKSLEDLQPRTTKLMLQ
ncbi:hypothetical protein BT96DRAFT_976085 [Gymnopus androsaceus JB14]|uniref:Uncharacterized protein n=1 Tax=Gymnopus androsaceus JB14 TaxID=1447944 RepID=A0A6A4HKI9_9AGAR|nr:hypothetical protein BT96DRAFT_976085 [Gymnopus androsaceus JB14]